MKDEMSNKNWTIFLAGGETDLIFFLEYRVPIRYDMIDKERNMKTIDKKGKHHTRLKYIKGNSIEGLHQAYGKVQPF